MSTATNAPTLYEDWLVRRDRLCQLPMQTGDRHHAELRLLEFLLAHYRGSPVAAQPARFPSRAGTYIDRRAIVVHNHLGKGYLSDVRTHQQAQRHVRAVLDRMTLPEREQPPDRPLFDPAAPPAFSEELEDIRGRLCERDADVRLVSIVELGGCGTLDDIGLLSDLLALPPQPDEDPYERHVLLTAMKKIVRRLTGVKDIEVPFTTMSAEPPEVYEPVPSDVTAGLPKIYEPLLLTFYAEPQREGHWIVIGNDWGTELRVDDAGAVYSFDPSDEKATRFVNSSVWQLGRFIKMHRAFAVEPFSTTSDQASAIKAFRDQLANIDPAAFSNAENWWAAVVERMTT